MLRTMVLVAMVGCGAAAAPTGLATGDADGITSVAFERLDKQSSHGDTIRIVVASARSMWRGGANFSIRVGEETASLGIANFSDGSLNFFLTREPAEGAIVYAGWTDAPLEATRFRYHRPTP